MVTVVSQHGRPDDGTDATGFFNAEFFVPLKPFDTWPAGVDKDKLTEQMTAKLEDEFPGVDFNFSQYIEDNVEEAASGVKGENSVKLFGGDLETLEKHGEQDQGRDGDGAGHHRPRGVRLRSASRRCGSTSIARKAARYGLAPGDINTTIQAAIGGQAAGNLYEDGSDRNFPIIVRLAPEYRNSLDAIRHICRSARRTRTAAAWCRFRCRDVATVRLTSGASFIYREGQERYIPIKFSVRGRDLGSAVLEAQQKVARRW